MRQRGKTPNVEEPIVSNKLMKKRNMLDHKEVQKKLQWIKIELAK